MTDAGVACLARLELLEALSLSGFPRLTDAGVRALLAAAPRLRRLHVAGCGRATAQGCAAAAEAMSKAWGRLITVEWSRR